MARIVGGIGSSHVPAISGAIAQGLQQDEYWKGLFDGYPPVHDWLEEVQPDVAVVVYNDHGLNFFLDKMPTFSIGAAKEYRNEDEGWGLGVTAPFIGHEELSWHIINELIPGGFDLTTCQEMLVDHGFVVPMQLLWPREPRPLKVVPVCVNTVQHPLPTPARCFALGQALGRAIESFDDDLRVVVLGTGGLSHQLDGERAGFINKEFDMLSLDAIANDPEKLTEYSIVEIIREAGAQGAEIILWLAMRGALSGTVAELHRNYHIPISNTAAGLLLLENAV